ncbi:AAA family ATPase, partial [Patescibacteria group bacterium]|nr:AAA family ATPase [Patescibacteria group bacterium]
MPEVLYRKYRPKTFADVTNQNHVKVTLQNQIETDKVAHAYIFAGPRGIGKTTIARLLAKTVNCQNRQGSEPCNACDHCQHLDQGRALDIIEMDAASHTGVDNVRENIIEAVRFVPGQGRYKVFIIDEAHMLSISAFNALLKTLEEP